jgi:hypothetical protein
MIINRYTQIKKRMSFSTEATDPRASSHTRHEPVLKIIQVRGRYWLIVLKLNLILGENQLLNTRPRANVAKNTLKSAKFETISAKCDLGCTMKYRWIGRLYFHLFILHEYLLQIAYFLTLLYHLGQWFGSPKDSLITEVWCSSKLVFTSLLDVSWRF